jgi:hypothetical protein
VVDDVHDLQDTARVELRRAGLARQQEEVAHVFGVRDAQLDLGAEGVPHVVERTPMHVGELAAVFVVVGLEPVDPQELIDLGAPMKTEAAPIDGRPPVQQQPDLLDILQAETRHEGVGQGGLEDQRLGSRRGFRDILGHRALRETGRAP